jgi:TrfB plasmid transcriptional repressor
MTAIDHGTLDRIAQQRRFEPRTLEIAKRLFLHGEPAKRLAVEYGVNIQRVYAIRREVLDAGRTIALPPGWEEVTIAGPKALIEQIKRQVAEALGKLDRGGKPPGRIDE